MTSRLRLLGVLLWAAMPALAGEQDPAEAEAFAEVMCGEFKAMAEGAVDKDTVLASWSELPGRVYILDRDRRIRWQSRSGGYAAKVLAGLQEAPSGLTRVFMDLEHFDLDAVSLGLFDCGVAGVTILWERTVPLVPQDSAPFTGKWIGAMTGRSFPAGSSAEETDAAAAAGGIQCMIVQDGGTGTLCMRGPWGTWQQRGIVAGSRFRLAGLHDRINWSADLEYIPDEDVVRGQLRGVGPDSIEDLQLFLKRYRGDPERAEAPGNQAAP